MDKTLSIKYDELYEKASSLFKKYNPCNISHNKCINDDYEEELMLCCVRCEHWKKDIGCTIKSLSCKLWTCHTIQEKRFIHGTGLRGKGLLYQFLKELDKLREEAKSIFNLGYRDSKTEIINRTINSTSRSTNGNYNF